jgi:hypothetical protein
VVVVGSVEGGSLVSLLSSIVVMFGEAGALLWIIGCLHPQRWNTAACDREGVKMPVKC